MKLLTIATIGLLAGMITEAQYSWPYGGAPMWDRRTGDYPPPPRVPPDEYRHPHYPTPGHWGPQVEPCIYSGRCRR
jgi:hypothetical protein